MMLGSPFGNTKVHREFVFFFGLLQNKGFLLILNGLGEGLAKAVYVLYVVMILRIFTCSPRLFDS